MDYKRFREETILSLINQVPYNDYQGLIVADMLRWIGVSIGEGTRISSPLNLDLIHGFKVGRDCTIGRNLYVYGNAYISDRVLISSNCTIAAVNHKRGEKAYIGSVYIESDVWIGANVTILPDISIGRGATLGAGSVVTKHVKPGDTVVGNPARSIGLYREAHL